MPQLSDYQEQFQELCHICDGLLKTKGNGQRLPIVNSQRTLCSHELKDPGSHSKHISDIFKKMQNDIYDISINFVFTNIFEY